MYYSLFFAILSISSRGFFEIYVSKSLAYFITLTGFSIGISFFYLSSNIKFKFIKSLFALVFFFLSSIIFSIVFSIYHGIDSLYLLYIIYPLVIIFFFIIFYSINVNINTVKLYHTLAFVVLILFFTALLQQLEIIKLPGITWTFGILIRPSSLTGSYLHYPLIMVLYSSIMHSLKKKLDLLSILGYGSVFLAFSRSGMMLVVSIFFFIFLFTSLEKNNKLINKKTLQSFFLIVIVLAISSIYIQDFNLIMEKLLSTTNISSSGNEGRVENWQQGFQIISESNFLFGNNFGKITNFTSNIIGQKSEIVESGLIQNLINFGLLGTILFYLFFLYMYLYSKNTIQKVFILAFFLQSFVYQSTEVLPFIIGTFLLFGLTKNNLKFKL